MESGRKTINTKEPPTATSTCNTSSVLHLRLELAGGRGTDSDGLPGCWGREGFAGAIRSSVPPQSRPTRKPGGGNARRHRELDHRSCDRGGFGRSRSGAGHLHLQQRGEEDTGKYVTAWRKITGAWKVAADIGVSTVPEEEGEEGHEG
jgi:hypothetical protein